MHKHSLVTYYVPFAQAKPVFGKAMPQPKVTSLWARLWAWLTSPAW